MFSSWQPVWFDICCTWVAVTLIYLRTHCSTAVPISIYKKPCPLGTSGSWVSRSSQGFFPLWLSCESVCLFRSRPLPSNVLMMTLATCLPRKDDRLVNLLRQSLLCRKRRERRRYYRNHYLLRPPATRHLTVDQLLRVPNRVLRSKTPLISRSLTSNKNPLSEGLRFIVQAGLVYKTRTLLISRLLTKNKGS